MWKKTKCFTLMELLVVISVVALLLAVLMPSLQKAKEMAGRIVCGNHEKQLAMANNLYANSWDENFCPALFVNGEAPDAPPPGDKNRFRKNNWLGIEDFREIMALDEQAQAGIGGLHLPDEYYCPADKLARYKQESQYYVLVSYAYNITDFGDEMTEVDYWNCTAGPSQLHMAANHKRTAIPRASEKVNFTDSSDWWCTWWGANYVKGWDKVGHGTWEDYEAVGIWGPVLYRHNEGANLVFYDGHVEWMTKGKVFVDTDGDPSDNTDEKDATGMWYVDWPQ
jgi:prepilin-type processing-associated H-X9-DG protein